MKKLLMLGTLLSITSLAFADICADILSNYDRLIQQLQTDTNAALSVTTDPGQQEALRQSYQMQLSQLQAQKDSALTSAGCISSAPPSTDPGTTTPPPTTDPGTTPPPSTDPGT